MCETCNHITTYQQLRQADPTKTNVLRASFVKDMDRRFNKIKKMIVEAVVTNDVFGLNPNIQANAALPKKAFQFNTNAEKVEKLMSWIQRQVDDELLAVEFRSQLGQASQAPWTNMYISDSYKRGIDRAAYEAKKAKIPGAKTVAERGGIEAVMGTPIHMDRLGMLYTRSFTELKGITAAMDSQMSKVLAQGIADGDAPATIARKLTKTIGGGLDLVTKTKAGIERLIPAQVRAQTLARTEVIRAHHAATIQEYRNFGLAGVKVQAEWSTAGDNRVCTKCAPLEGKIYTLDEIEPMIPFHPNCRCMALPVLDESSPVKVKVSTPPIIVDKKQLKIIDSTNRMNSINQKYGKDYQITESGRIYTEFMGKKMYYKNIEEIESSFAGLEKASIISDNMKNIKAFLISNGAEKRTTAMTGTSYYDYKGYTIRVGDHANTSELHTEKDFNLFSDKLNGWISIVAELAKL